MFNSYLGGSQFFFMKEQKQKQNIQPSNESILEMFVEEKKLNSFNNIYLEAKKDYTFRANLRKGKLHLWLKVFQKKKTAFYQIFLRDQSLNGQLKSVYEDIQNIFSACIKKQYYQIQPLTGDIKIKYDNWIKQKKIQKHINVGLKEIVVNKKNLNKIMKMDERVRRQLENQQNCKIKILKNFCSFLPDQKKKLIQWYNTQSPYLQKFSSKGQQIYPIPQENQCQWIQLLTNRIVPISQRQTYTLKVSRNVANSVFEDYEFSGKQKLVFGLVDKQRIRFKSSLDFKRSLYFFVNERTGQVGGEIESQIKKKEVMDAYSEISEGLVIKMQIIRNEGKIFWFVQNKEKTLWIQIAYVQSQMLKEQRIKFVPYVEFFNFSNRILIESQEIQQIPLISDSIKDNINELSQEQDFEVKNDKGFFDPRDYSDSPDYQFRSD